MQGNEATAQWVLQARRGSGDAWTRLFRRFAPLVHGVLLGQVQAADAEDLTQQVFETALARLHELREDAAFPGWLLRIARRAAQDLRRTVRPLTGFEHDAPSGCASHEDRTDAERVLAALRSLPEAYRETLALRLVEGWSGPEIAAATGLTPGSVRVNLHRGMALLREAIAENRT